MKKPLQATFAGSGFEAYRKPTRRELFLAQMERVVPWVQLVALIEPVYPKPHGAGRRPIGLERMLRIYFLQQWVNRSDPAVEEALYDSAAMRAFVGIDLGREPAPDETKVCTFRHLLEAHALGRALFEEVGRHLQAQGLKVSSGTIVDATIIHAPNSTKNASGAYSGPSRSGSHAPCRHGLKVLLARAPGRRDDAAVLGRRDAAESAATFAGTA